MPVLGTAGEREWDFADDELVPEEEGGDELLVEGVCKLSEPCGEAAALPSASSSAVRMFRISDISSTRELEV